MKKFLLLLPVILIFSILPIFAEEEWSVYKLPVEKIQMAIPAPDNQRYIPMKENFLFKIPYKITNGQVVSMEGSIGGLEINIKTENKDGMVEVIIPRNLADVKKYGGFVLIDSELTRNYVELETNPCFNTFLISFPANSKNIEIGTTYFSGPPTITGVLPVNFDLKNNYEPDKVTAIAGCTDLSIHDEELIVQIAEPDGKIYKTTSIIPNVDGTFSSIIDVDEQAIKGLYTVQVTYGNYTAIPEFSSLVYVVLVMAISFIFISQHRIRNLN